MKNKDKIRAANDEELASLLSKLIYRVHLMNLAGMKQPLTEDLLVWLEQEDI